MIHAEPFVRGYAVTHPPGDAALPIQNGWDQLLYAQSGTMTISTTAGSWVIPPHRALWVPHGAQATLLNRSPVTVRSLYLASSLGVLPPISRAVNIPRFTRELLIHIVLQCPLDLGDPVDQALMTVLTEQLRRLPEAPLWLPLPSDPRAAELARRTLADTAADLPTLLTSISASRRTLERLFATQTGMSLGAWRRRARILGSLDALTTGTSVTRTAIDAGYGTPSAYVAAFKNELGETPRRFLNR